MTRARRASRPTALIGLIGLIDLIGLVGCAADGGGGRRDGGPDPEMDARVAPDAGPECVSTPEDTCPTGFVCAAVMSVPTCIPDPDPPPPGDGSDCRPCDAPGECRMGVCVQPSESGRFCEFDPECGTERLCIAGRCTHDPRIPQPCADDSMCEGALTCDGELCVCLHTTDCPIGLICDDMGRCSSGPGGGTCVADDECETGAVCDAGRCRPGTVCDVGHPDFAGTWNVATILNLREALPSWLSSFLDAVAGPFRFLSGDEACIDFGLPDWVESAICDLVRPYVEAYLPPWAPDVFRAIADLNDILSTWEIDETMVLNAGSVTDSYRGTHTWTRVRFMYRGTPVEGLPEDIISWRFAPSEFNASAVCGTFNIERHNVHISIGSVIGWLVDAIIYEASDHRWSSLGEALSDLAGGFCMGLADAAEENIDYDGVGATVMSLCTSTVSTLIDAAVREVLDARLGADAMTLRGSAPVTGPSSLRPGVWDGTLLGSGFSGTFDASR